MDIVIGASARFQALCFLQAQSYAIACDRQGPETRGRTMSEVIFGEATAADMPGTSRVRTSVVKEH
jgi:hypothetical protein